MKVLVVQDANWTKKGPHTQHHLMEELSSRGHEIVVVGYNQLWIDEKWSLVSKRSILYNFHRLNVRAKITYISPFFLKIPFLDYFSYLITSRNEIKKCINQLNPDVVIGFTSIISNYWGMSLAKKNKIPFLYYWTDIIHELIPFKPFQLIAKPIEKSILNNSTEVIATNEDLKDYLIKFNVKSTLIHIFPNGVDLKRFNPYETSSNNIREKYNLSKNDLVLFFMGWIYDFSGLKEVILELYNVKNLHPNIKLVVVGNGDYYLQLKELVKSLGMEDCVCLTGERPYDEIPELIAAADICLLPAYDIPIMRNIVPIKMYEYLAMHKPIISTKLPGVYKEFGDDSGVIYVAGPEEVIKKATVITPEELQRNSEMAKRFIRKYSWDNITSEFENMLCSVTVR